MSAIKLQLLRAERGRYPLKDHCDIKLISIDDGMELTVKGVDTSNRGFGFITSRPLATGKIYWMVLQDRKISIEVMHCESYLGIENMFRCGAFARDPNADFQQFFQALGFLASDAPTS